MITAVDTSVLLDVFLPDDRYGEQSKTWLRAAYDTGAIIVSDIVYAELAPAFPDRAVLDRALREINATTSPVDTAIAYDAGMRWLHAAGVVQPRGGVVDLHESAEVVDSRVAPARFEVVHDIPGRSCRRATEDRHAASARQYLRKSTSGGSSGQRSVCYIL